MKKTMQKAAIVINILVLCMILSFNSNAQNGNRAEDFINAVIKLKRQHGSDAKYFIYPTTLTDCKSYYLTMAGLRNNRKPFLGSYNPYNASDTVSILKYLSQDDVRYMKQQLDNIESTRINQQRVSKRIRVVRTKVPLDSMKNKFVRKETLYQFSNPLFSRDSTIAVVYNNSYSYEVEGGDLIIFKKDGKEWGILAFVDIWICFFAVDIPPKKSFVKRIFTSKRR